MQVKNCEEAILTNITITNIHFVHQEVLVRLTPVIMVESSNVNISNLTAY